MSKQHERVGTFCEKCRQVMCKCVSKEQTAVDYLVKSLFDKGVDIIRFIKEIQEAKEMEKKQTVDAFDFGIASVIKKYDKAFSEIDGDEYYEKKYQK